MPAAVAKGILLSISIITALGLAVYENPQVQSWLEEQRRKIQELLRQIGEELDPASRRAAEAFAFEGRTTSNDAGLRREAAGSQDAAALATGRSLSNASTIRRIPVRGPSDPDEAEERRRKGREYLARRNQQMYELQRKRKAAKAEGLATPPTPTFDELVDAEGKLKAAVDEEALPSPPAMEPLPSPIKDEMHQVEQHLSQPLTVGESSSSNADAWQMGARLANPFADEFEIERSMTPRPPIPPKIELAPTLGQQVYNQGNHALQDYQIQLMLLEQQNKKRLLMARQEQDSMARPPNVPGLGPNGMHMNRLGMCTGGDIPSCVHPPPAMVDRAQTPQIAIPGSFDSISNEAEQPADSIDHSGLSYEEQLAIAMSLSEQESSINSATVRQNRPEQQDDDDDLRAAIAASLRDMDDQQAAHAVANAGLATPQVAPSDAQPLVDLTPSTPPAMKPRSQSYWESLFDPQFSPSQEPLSLVPQASNAPSEASDELYRLTPELNRARLAHYDAPRDQSVDASTPVQLPFDPVRDAASASPQAAPDVMDASFYSAAAEASPAPSSQTFDHQTPQLVDVAEDVPQAEAHTPTSRTRSSFGFHTDSDSETWASASAPQSRAQSRPRSEISNVEVIDLEEDSDVDMLSEVGDGVRTPDSWSEVGSRDAESDSETEDRSSRLA